MDYIAIAIQHLKQVLEEFPEGITFDVTAREIVATGYSVGLQESGTATTYSGPYHCIQHSLTHYHRVACWFNPLYGHYQYRSVRLFTDIEKARKFAIKQQQEAIFCNTTRTVIYL